MVGDSFCFHSFESRIRDGNCFSGPSIIDTCKGGDHWLLTVAARHVSRRRGRAGLLWIRAACVLFCGLLASGCLWDAVQVFAWARMFAGNLEERPVAEALSVTFSGESTCGLCKTVATAREGPPEDAPVIVNSLERPLLLPLFRDMLEIPAPPSMTCPRRVSVDGLVPAMRMKPPVPPPRIG
jgi:hypothetical protein